MVVKVLSRKLTSPKGSKRQNWQKSKPIDVNISTYMGTAELGVFEKMPLEAFLALCQTLGCQIMGARLDKIKITVTNENDENENSNTFESHGNLEKTLADLNIQDGYSISFCIQRDLCLMTKARRNLQTAIHTDDERRAKYWMNILIDHKKHIYEKPPDSEHNGGKLYHWLPCIRDLISSNIEKYYTILAEYNTRLLIALQKQNYALFRETVIESHQRVYSSATLSYVGGLQLTIQTKNNYLPINLEECHTVGFLFTLIQVMDPDLIGRDFALKGMNGQCYANSICCNSTLEQCGIAELSSMLLNQQVLLRTELTDCTRNQIDVYLELPSVLKHLEVNEHIRWFVRKFNPRLEKALQKRATEDRIDAVHKILGERLDRFEILL